MSNGFMNTIELSSQLKIKGDSDTSHDLFSNRNMNLCPDRI